ncbi:hypothetical protein QUF54_08340, partial [Candidatus Marithioploca araucensis]|nr:hypothetical protein [Candidatus Marithioploca araucensis]
MRIAKAKALYSMMNKEIRFFQKIGFLCESPKLKHSRFQFFEEKLKPRMYSMMNKEIRFFQKIGFLCESP